ncbi:transcriptional repressor for ribose metabolism domain protein [Escherichia coli 1-392-07_S1_C2]|nr:transcriptional repressor for ribose metabolism domain protein [Escherichia coli 1-392-07_S1_C2]
MARAPLPKRPDNVYYRPLRKPVIDPMASRVRWLQGVRKLMG